MNRTLVVALLVVLGGVGGAPTFSTAATDANESTETSDLPPGLAADGVTDPLALADAHHEALRDASYTVSTSYEFRRPNGTLVGHGTSTSAVAPGRASFHTVSTRTYRDAGETLGLEHVETATWGEDDRAVTARTRSNGSTEYRERALRPSMRPDTGSEALYTAFSAVDTTVATQAERNGTTLYKVVTTSEPAPESVYAGDATYSAVAFVDSDGVVRTFRQTYRTTYGDRPAIATRTVRVDAVGNTTVERPAWADRATENATAEAG